MVQTRHMHVLPVVNRIIGWHVTSNFLGVVKVTGTSNQAKHKLAELAGRSNGVGCCAW